MFINKKKIVATTFLISVISISTLHNYESYKVQHSLKNCVIRFHVRANSDSLEDQSLKMSIKDDVINYIHTNSEQLNTLNDTKDFLLSHEDEISQVALNKIHKKGYNYSVSTSYGLQDFPNKSYGGFLFPKGKYISYTINIGSGNGHNWWCVLYPQLCFVDSCYGTLPTKSKEILKDNIPNEDYEYVSKNSTVFRFKYLTFLNKYMH